MPRIETRKCACDRKYDVLWTRTGEGKVEEPSALDRPELDDLRCPACDGTDYRVVIGLATGIELGGAGGVGKHYPYFDRALKCWVDSAQHRRRICKERNLIPAEDIDLVADYSRIQSERDAAEAEYQAVEKQYREDPEYRETYGKLMERLATVDNPNQIDPRLVRG
jgi:hypothetical protein